MDELNRMKEARKKLRDAAAKGATKKAEVGTPTSASGHSTKNTMPLRQKQEPKTANPYAGINTIPLRQRTEAESTNPYIRALAERGRTTGQKLAETGANIYQKALSGSAMPTGATWEDTNALARRTPAAPAGDTWEDANALARETAPAPTYAELLKRNYAAQFSGQGVTQQMQDELENAGRAESDYRARKRRAAMDRIGQDIAANMNPYANVQPAAPERKAAADGVTEQMTTAEVKAALPGLQEAADYARDRYQKIWDRNIRIGTDQGQVPPEMIAELWEAERDKNETEQRLNLALARNEELSYGDMLGNTKTDLSRVGELQERLEKVTGAGGSTRGMSVDQIRTEQQEVVGALNGIRASLRAEGYSDEEITALFGYLRRERNAENAQAMQEEARAAAAERGSLGNLAINTGTGLLGGAGYIDLAMQNLFAGQDAVTGQRARVDYNSPAQSMYQIGEATMQGEMDKLLDRYGVTDENGNRDFTTEGKIRAGAYQLTASMGQSATVAGLTAMGVPCAMLLLSGNAATQTTHEMHEKGYSDGTALLMGGIAGAAEYVTEKIGMDELFKTRDISTAKNLLRGLLHNQVNQAMAEGGEEVLSTVINTLADLIVNGDKNELETRYREFLSAGYTPEQAEKAAAQEWLGGVWQDFYMGALSGLLFGGAGTAIQSASNAVADTRTGKTILSEGTANALIDEIGALDSDIAQTANVPAVDENSKARQLGAAQRGLERARTMENMRAELEARGEENVTPALLSGLYASSQRQEQRLTGEEKRAMRGSETAQELAEEWAKQWKDGSVPAPFAGAEDVLRERLAARRNAPGEQGATTEGVFNNGEQSDRGGQTGNDALGTGREGIDYEGRTASSELDTGNAAGQGSDRFQDLVREEVTPAALGVDNGSTTATVKVLDESRFEAGSSEARAVQKARAAGLEPVIISGTIQIGEGENAKQARAYIKGNRVILQADGKVTAEQLLDHELYHQEAIRNPNLNKMIRQALANNMSEQEISDLVDRYITAYDGIYDFSGMTQKQIEAICEEEMFADLYAGIDNFNRVNLRDTARGAYAEAQTMRQQNAESRQDTTGPPEGKAYTYDALIKKQPMQVTELEEDLNEAALNERVEILDKGIENIRKMDNPLNTEQHQFVHVGDTGYDLRVTRDGLRHGIAKMTNRSGKSTAAVTQKIGDILSNAIKVNEMKRRATDPPKVTGKDVLLGYADDGENGYVVRAIATLTDGAADLQGIEVYPLLYSVKAKNVDSSIVHTAMTENGQGQDPQAIRTITIQQLLDLVKNQYPDILSDDALRGVGSSREEALAMDGSIKDQMRFSAEVPAEKGKPLDQRVSGDQLLDAQDLIETVEAVGAAVDENGYVTLYHRTNPAVADKIRRTGRMTAREDGLFFSTKKEGGQNEGFGSAIIEMKIPAEELVLDDIFDDEAHVKVPLPGGRWSRDVSGWIVKDDSTNGKTDTDGGNNKEAQYNAAERDYNLDSEMQRNWENKIDLIKNTRKISGEEDHIDVRGNTPRAILDNDKTARDLPIRIRYDAAYLATRDNGEQPGHYHALGDLMKQLPAKLENPVLILKLDNGRVNCLIEIKDKNERNILVSVELNQWNTNTGDSYNLIVTTFGAGKNYLKNLVQNKGAKVLYATEEASHFIPGLNNTTGNDLDTSSEESRVTQNKGKSNPQNEGRASAEVPAETRTAEEYEADRKKALEYFGTTYNTNEAGYITTDGRYLDFSGRHEGAPGGRRTLDHRDIADAFDGDYGDGSYSGAMVEFMRGGNIRVSPESGGIDLMGKPTKQQTAKLEQYIQKFRGEVILDLDDRNGDTKASVEYPKYTRSSTILQDINDYFDRGIVPKVYENGRASAEVPAEGKLWLDDEATAADAAKAAEDGRTVAMENGSGRIEIRRTSKGNYAVEFYDRAEEAYGERPNSTAIFKTAGEAAEYADAYRSSYQTALEDAELDEARGKPESGKPKGEAGTIPAPFAGTGTTAAEDYNNEVIRQKKAKAAEVNTQTLRERIRRADEELRALRRLDKTTELTEAQKAHKADVQETLEIMNDELERRKAQAKANRGKGKTAKEKPARAVESMPTKSARDARLALQDMFSTRRGAWNETGKAIDEKLAEIARSGRISEESRQELFDILMDNGAVYKEAEEVFRNIRDAVRGSRLYVSEHDRHDFGDNWDSLRKKAFAAGIYLTNDITDQKVDSLVQELGETFGENLFPQDDALSDMLNNLIERSEQGRNTWQPLSESIEDEAKRYREDPQEIFDSMWEQMNRTLQTFAEKADLEIDLKERSAAQLAEERKRWEDRMERRSRARLESEIRGKVLKGLQRLARAKNKTAPDTKAQIEEVLKDIDTQARQITPAGLEDLQGLYRAYEDAKKDAGYQDDENMGNWIPNPYVEERLARLTQKHVNDMSIDEVIELGRTVAALEHSIATQNQMLGEEWDRTITEEAYNVRREVEAAKGAKAGFLHKWAKEEHLSPRRFLEMLGGWTDGTMKKLSHSLEEGQTRMLDFQRRATQSFDSFLSKKENRKWLEKASGKKAEWTKYTVLDGMDEDGGSYVDIELTPMMKISLYLHSRNMDNLRHIQTGGLVIPNKELYRQGKIAEAYAQGQRVKMNPETVRKIAGELTATEKTFANHMTKVFDEISKDAINEVSLQLDGFERAGVDNYMPIETARQFIKSDVAGEARAQTVEGIGSIANERIHASNPIVLSDASDVLMRQIDKVSRYYGYAIPIRNFQAVNNYVFHKEGNAFETSVKELMDRKWGAGAEQYITKMLEDLQSNGRQGDMMSSALAKLRGNLAGATLMFNPSVALSQVASYPGAAQVVGWDGLAAGLTAGKVDTGLMEKYTPLYWYRNQGNSTQELGDYMKDKGLEQKLPWILNWIQKMDSATIRRLWAASEYRVRKDNPGLKPGPQADIDAGTDAYYKAVAEVFNRAVYDTQPNYTNMERAQILRSKSDVTRFLTMYKTVPLQYYGMMVEASGRLEAARKAAKADGSEANQEALRKAQKYAVNTYGGLLAANAAYVTVKALFKGLRGKDKDYRDEEGKLTAGSVSRQLGRDLLETYAGSIIGGAEALDVADSLITGSKFYGPEMSALSYVEDMVNAVQSIVSAAQSEDPRKAAKAVKDGAETLAQGFGVPAKNLETYTIGIIGNLWPEVGVEYQNMFGGIDRSNLKGMDEDALGTAAGLILSGRTGEKTDRAVSDELARLYAAGETVAVPTSTPQSFSYNGVTVQIRDRNAYSDTWGGIVNDCMEPLMASQDYLDADDSGKASLINRLYEYATVQARKGADSNYTAEGNSTYGWTVKADEAVEAGVPVVDTICALTAFSGMTADKDENGNSISGSKKAKVCDYIDEMDITDEQKDVMYLLAGYKENSLEYTPWHGYVEEEGSGSEKKSGSGKVSKSGRSGGRRRGSGGSSRAVKAKSLPGVGVSGIRRSAGANVPAGNTGGRIQGDVTDRLLEIIDKYYDGNMLAAAFDGGRKARNRIDFEI